MGLTQLLPPSLRRRVRRLRQNAVDVRTTLTVARRPVARTGALTDPGVFAPPQADRPIPTRQPARTPSDAPGRARVFFADFDTELAVDDDQSILQAGLQAGLDLDFSCTLGGCAACALRLVEGEVVYDGPNCLSQAERDSGMCLACVGRPRGRIVVESL